MVCLYITHLVKTVCFVTIKNYISSLWVLHDIMGMEHVDPEDFLIKCTITGAKRVLGSATRQVDPLTPQDLLKIYAVLKMDSWTDFTFWCALTLCYRCLLRVSHVTASPHTMRIKDIRFWRGGMDVWVHSSKTIQYRERSQRIPVTEAGASPLCPVIALRAYIKAAGLKQQDVVFSYTYKSFNAKLKDCIAKAGLKGDFASHSIRRGSASYLASFLPLHEVKRYGDWKSLAVLLYISDNYSSRRAKDALVARQLSKVK